MSAPDIAVEHLGADYFQDPYSVHARLRARRPVTRVIMPGGIPVWLVTGYAEARAALADPRLSKRMPGWHPEPDSIIASMDLHMLNTDPPDGGLPQAGEQGLHRAPGRAAQAADRRDHRGAARRHGASRGPVRGGPARVVRVPAADHGDLRAARRAGDRDDFRTWSATIVSDTPAPGVFQAHATAMARYFMALLAAKRQQPRDDLLSALLAARGRRRPASARTSWCRWPPSCC